MADSPVTATQIRSWTSKDPELAPIVQYLQHGWPTTTTTSESNPFLSKKQNYLCMRDACCGELGLWFQLKEGKVC